MITGNWAGAALGAGDLTEAKRLNLRSAEAARQAGTPEVNAVGSELEALRIDVQRGDPAAALPEIEARLARVRAWWQHGQAGETVAEAPDRIVLGRRWSARSISLGGPT